MKEKQTPCTEFLYKCLLKTLSSIIYTWIYIPHWELKKSLPFTMVMVWYFVNKPVMTYDTTNSCHIFPNSGWNWENDIDRLQERKLVMVSDSHDFCFVCMVFRRAQKYAGLFTHNSLPISISNKAPTSWVMLRYGFHGQWEEENICTYFSLCN
jgi:hypothetical protein